jgi:hypothetical protein
MENAAMILAEIVSAILCFVLLKYMITPYRVTRETRYIGLPLGFAFLGVSYLFMGFAYYFETFLFVEEIKWLQLFTQAYAFVFLAATYYFSKSSKRKNIWWNITYAGLVLVAIISYVIIFEPPMLGLPNYKTVDEYFRLFNILCISYIFVHTLISHLSKPDPKTFWIPLSYLLLAFGQYSSLIWSLETVFVANVGAHILRIAGLTVFVFVVYQTFFGSRQAFPKEGIWDEEASAQR